MNSLFRGFVNVYQATVTCQENHIAEKYVGLTENDFKTRYRNHTASFWHAKHRNSIELTANTSGLSKKTTLTSSFHGAIFHLADIAHHTTAQVKDVHVTSA